MKKTLISTLVAAACALGLPAAQAQVSDGIIKIGVLTDMSSLYTDLSGKGSETAARFAIEDFQKTSKAGLKVEVVSADHQNKPDVGSNVARQWYDVDKVDVIVDTPNSGVALAVNQITREKGKAFLVSGAATAELTGKSCSPNTIHWTYDTWMLANGTGNAIVKTGGDTWFFLTADYAFGQALERDTEAVVLKNGVRVRHRQGWPESRRPAGVHHRRALARTADRTGFDFHRNVLLGSERPDACLCQALCGAEPWHPSDHDSRWRLLRGAALPESGRGSQD
jgi:branched-chain amino acid transport system substrate-binding protein